jgi:phosphoribosyl-AMP cyclohydrolase
MMDWLDDVHWNEQGLVPAVAQELGTGQVLMVAWMNREALAATLRDGKATYYSRSRQRLWQKGEESGHEQILHELRLDCDKDTVLLVVEQKGGIACHTGRHHCFFHRLEDGAWQPVEPVLKDSKDIYGGK